MSDTPRTTPPDTGPTESGDLSGISEMFGLRDGEPAGDTGTRTGTDTAGQWVAATEQAAQPPDVFNAMRRAMDGWVAATEGKSSAPEFSGRLVHGRYRLIAELGVGGMGVTYRAWDTQAHVPVVVKMPKREVRSDREAMQRFAREIEAMRAVPHGAIVPITDHGDDDGCPFVVMRFLPGGSLADYRRWDEAGNPIRNPPGMLHFWLPGVAAALDHIHAKGMLHRDVKPGNIFLDGFLKPYLGDFGIAKVVDESGGLAKEETLTATKMAVGTPEYMAPELFKPRSKPDGRADQYALAVTVYEMLAGDKPFKGDRAHIIVEHSGLPVPPLAGKVPGLPQRLYLAVEKSLAKKAEDRFATCSEFAAAVLEEVSVLPPEPDTVRLLCPSCKNILKLPQRAAGRTGRCPRCQAAMDVAADLGSLWLEAEERGGEAMVPAPSQAPPAVREQTQPEKRSASPAWNGRRRAAAAVAVAVATVVGVILLQRFLSQQRSVAIPRAAPATTSATRNEQAREAAQHAAELRRLQTALEEARAVAQSTSNANQRLQRAIDEARTSQAALASKADELQMALDEAQKSLVAATGRADGLAMKQDGLTTDVRRLSEALSTPDALTNSIGMRFRLCRSGTFPMGDATGNSDEEPLHVVAITKPFYIGMYEVTNSQWMRVMGEVPSTWKDADQPVANVTWDDVNEFCRRLSALSEEQGAGRVYRLPTEAEWEYACRAGTTTRWSFGDDKSRLVEYAWVGRQAERQTHPVGQKKPNGWGLYDMYGNVWEWCSDWYDENYYATSPAVDPQGPASGGSRRVDRGGASGVDAVISRSAFRHSNEPRHRHDILGFRVVLSSSGTAEAAAAR